MLLFQTGYATVRQQEGAPQCNGFRYRLGFPNHEVQVSLPRAILGRYVSNLIGMDFNREQHNLVGFA